MIIRKRAGAREQDGMGGVFGMTSSMKEHTKEALVGHMGEKDKEED